MEGEPRDKEDHLEKSDIHDADCKSWKQLEGASSERSAPSSFSETLPAGLQGSDSFPSIVLAVFLTLLFVVVVSFLLLHQNQERLPLEHCRALEANQPCPWASGLRPLTLLFPNQMETTWKVLQEYLYGPLEGINADQPWILVAVGLGDARNTLLCFLKATLVLLTEDHAVKIQFLEQRSSWLSRMPCLGNGTSITSATEIYTGQSPTPYGVVLSVQTSLDGEQRGTKSHLALMVNGTERAREKVLLRGARVTGLSDVLEAVHVASWVPDQLPAVDRRLVLLLRAEPHLEDGFVC